MKFGFFSADQVCQLAKISGSQLRYWRRTGVFQPQTSEGAGAFRYFYSFRDVVGLRTISILRNKYGVGLDSLRLIERKLKDTDGADWSSVAFYVGEDHGIYFVDPETKDTVAMKPMGQRPLFKVRAIARQIENNLARMGRRTRSIGKIDQSRFIMRNAHVIAGTRIPTSAVWEYHKAGYSKAKIIEQFPRLTIKDVEAAIQWENLRVKKKATG
ncbi:MAG TPA: DUF433 domain-containing protein [Candidatus Binataceae bacterium]|nr:DUF433 domain-containing protein [Candidatus Binataceae bacterium]